MLRGLKKMLLLTRPADDDSDPMIYESENKNGNTYQHTSVDYKIMRDAGDRAIALLKEFGFTTLSLTRVATIIKNNPGNNEYDEYLNR